MVAPTLNPYEYQLGDGGMLLNGQSSILPFVLINDISGLDIPNIDSVDSEYDSRHGGYVYARYVGIRTIVLTGILYADPENIDVTIEELKRNFLPTQDNTELPFYYRGAGIGQRYMMVKPAGLSYNLTEIRSYGACELQITLKAGDPIAYTDRPDVTITSGQVGTLYNEGNVPTHPVVSFSGEASEVSISKVSTGETVTLTTDLTTDDVVSVDFSTKSCMLNGERASGYLTSLGWWSIGPEETVQFTASAIASEKMVNGSCNANFGTGFAATSPWVATQQSTADAHSGSKSLLVKRNTSSDVFGSVIVPTGNATLAAGTYVASLWVKGTMPHVNAEVTAGATVLASVSMVPVSSTTWTKIQLGFTITTSSGPIYFKFSDTGEASKLTVKNKVLYFDDFSLKSVSATISTTVTSKNGWL